MSIESWKEEFYPISAYEVAQNDDDLGMVNHCLQKWEGLKKSNCKNKPIFLFNMFCRIEEM